MARRIAVLSNPLSGKGRGGKAQREVVRELRGRGAEVREYCGQGPEQARALAAEALAEAPDVLVVVGGDGTLSAALEPLLAASVPVALVPAGTGNDLARALGLPRHDPAAAARLALDGVPRHLDVGRVRCEDRVTAFLTVAALGFDAKVSDRTNRLPWPHGKARYYLALAIEVLRMRAVRFSVGADGAEPALRPGTLMAVGNTDSYGGGMRVCAGAEPDDGALDVVHVAWLPRWRLFRLFPHLIKGHHLERPEVTHQRVEHLEVSAPELLVYADGERVGSGPCSVWVTPAALTMLVPA